MVEVSLPEPLTRCGCISLNEKAILAGFIKLKIKKPGLYVIACSFPDSMIELKLALLWGGCFSYGHKSKNRISDIEVYHD
jgi:hypothetical protein